MKIGAVAGVTDIREQYPLSDFESAAKIASQMRVKYPTDNVSGYPYVLTCDFMITSIDGIKARTIKMASELNNARVLEKLEDAISEPCIQISVMVT